MVLLFGVFEIFFFFIFVGAFFFSSIACERQKEGEKGKKNPKSRWKKALMKGVLGGIGAKRLAEDGESVPARST